MNETCDVENECVPVRPMNIKEKMLAAADMQSKVIEVLSSIKLELLGGDQEECSNQVTTCMDDVASQSLDRMDYILGLLCEIRDALGVSA